MNLYERHLRAALSIRGNGETPHRHLKPLANTDVDKHYRRKSLNIDPKYVKPLQDSNHKIETLKTHPGRFVCDSNDVKFIVRKYLKGVNPNNHELKMLGGKMGIKFYRDKNLNKWVVEKT